MVTIQRTAALAVLLLLGSVSASAAPSFSFESALGVTSNANLVQENPSSDRILKLGGLTRFPLLKSNGRFSLRYTDYAKESGNDLFSADLGVSGLPSHVPSSTYGARLSLRDYVKDDVGSTDEGFTHYGVIGNATLDGGVSKHGTWTYTPQVDLEHYPRFSSRNDLELSFRAEYEMLSVKHQADVSFGLTPALLVSSMGDFSKISVQFSADYEQEIGDDSKWGAYAGLLPTRYLSRETTSTALLIRGRKTTVTNLSAKETTLLFSPGIWWSKNLSSEFEFRTELSANFQNSKSDSFNYREFQAFASLHFYPGQ